MIMSGEEAGCTGMISEIRKESVLVAVKNREPLSSELPKRAENRLRQKISELFDDTFRGRQHISSDDLMVGLVGKGLLPRMGKAGKQQRAMIDALATHMLRVHHSITTRVKDEDEKRVRHWPISYDGKPVKSVVEVSAPRFPCERSLPLQTPLYDSLLLIYDPSALR
jgi:hypothetical protein